MPVPSTINFLDKDSGQPGFAAIRVEGDVVGVVLSLRDNGDIEVFLTKEEAAQFAVALKDASSLAD